MVRDRSTKRRLTVLVLALGLITAAPYLFRAFVDGKPNYRLGLAAWPVTMRGFPAAESRNISRVFQVSAGAESVNARFSASKSHSIFAWSVLVGRPQYREGVYRLPPESITLRVACAVALAFAWLLVVCGRLLARRLARTGHKPTAERSDA